VVLPVWVGVGCGEAQAIRTDSRTFLCDERVITFLSKKAF